MTPVARWFLAITSTLAVFAATAFAAGYTSMEMNDVRYKRLDGELPVPTKHFAHTAPWVTAATVVFGVVSGIGAARRNDSAVIVVAAIAWLFAFAWVLACFYVWRAPFILIGSRVGG